MYLVVLEISAKMVSMLGLMLSLEVHVLQHAVVVGPFQTDCDVTIRMSADALPQGSEVVVVW